MPEHSDATSTAADDADGASGKHPLLELFGAEATIETPGELEPNEDPADDADAPAP